MCGWWLRESLAASQSLAEDVADAATTLRFDSVCANAKRGAPQAELFGGLGGGPAEILQELYLITANKRKEFFFGVPGHHMETAGKGSVLLLSGC